MLPKNKAISTTIFLANVIFSHIMPFILGFYFCQSKSMAFLALFVASILFGLEFDYEKGKVSMTLRRIF
jgi:hypothetical protein